MIKKMILAMIVILSLTIIPLPSQKEFVPIRRVAENEDVELVLQKLETILKLESQKILLNKAKSDLNDARYELIEKLLIDTLLTVGRLEDNQYILEEQHKQLLEKEGESKSHIAESGSYYGQISKATGRPKTVHVKGYYRKNGTYVKSHYRSKPKK